MASIPAYQTPERSALSQSAGMLIIPACQTPECSLLKIRVLSLYIYLYACIYLCVQVCGYMHVRMYMHVRIYACMHVCVCMCVCVRVCVYYVRIHSTVSRGRLLTMLQYMAPCAARAVLPIDPNARGI